MEGFWWVIIIICFIAGLVGIVVIPPFGVVLVPFFLVLILELLQNRPVDKAFDIAFGTIVAFVGSTVARGLMQLIMMGPSSWIFSPDYRDEFKQSA